YKSKSYGPAMFGILWDRQVAKQIEAISSRRSSNRIENYVLKDELNRVQTKLESKGGASIRFGNLKTGHGYAGERGDFCVIAGVVSRKTLTLYYRSLEMMGGFAYDLTLIRYLERALFCDWKVINFVTAKCFVFALKGNSNEKLYPRLQNILKPDAG